MESVWPMEPKTTSWLATKPEERTEWTGTSSTRAPRAPRAPSTSVSAPGALGTKGARASAMSWAVRRAVPEGASFFLQWWNSMTSASGKYGAAAWANCIMSTAPVVKLGA